MTSNVDIENFEGLTLGVHPTGFILKLTHLDITVVAGSLSVVKTTDNEPFFSGTYISKRASDVIAIDLKKPRTTFNSGMNTATSGELKISFFDENNDLIKQDVVGVGADHSYSYSAPSGKKIKQIIMSNDYVALDNIELSD
ncbi:hypothetical protein [Pseudomonas sp.]|uniref:hypothetical protein n=1 Tax=Pseudomonas sp. TaxID=306 RepID=UPI003BB7D428